MHQQTRTKLERTFVKLDRDINNLRHGLRDIERDFAAGTVTQDHYEQAKQYIADNVRILKAYQNMTSELYAQLSSSLPNES